MFVACGLWLIALGVYFLVLRPALLPEDLRFIGSSLESIRAAGVALMSATNFLLVSDFRWWLLLPALLWLAGLWSYRSEGRSSNVRN